MTKQDSVVAPPGADTPEQRARHKIDAALVVSRWIVQDRDDMNVSAGRGVAVREFTLSRGHGSGERNKREATWSEKNPEGRWRVYGYDEILARDKVSLDLSWLRGFSRRARGRESPFE